MKNGLKKGFLLAKIDFVFLPTTFIVYGILVHCRIGSLENLGDLHQQQEAVHCRIGSLEIEKSPISGAKGVHCRIGSLEINV